MNALVDQVGRLIERTYDIDSGVVPMAPFVVGDEGHRRLVAGRLVRERVDHAGSNARVLLRRLGREPRWAAALYLPDALVEHLEHHDPRCALGDANVDEFATLVEEIDHLVTFADRSSRGADVSLLELEWHAAIGKYLVLTHFAARLGNTARLDERTRGYIEDAVFHRPEYADPDPAVRGRYREAHRLAWRFVQDLRTRPALDRVARLRRFHRAPHGEKLERFAS